MTTLRQQFIRELVLRGMAPRTQEAYVWQVYRLAKHYHRSPDQIGDEELKAFLFHLVNELKLSRSTLNQAVSALRSFYKLVLHRSVDYLEEFVPRMRQAIRRPRVYSVEELERLFTVGCPNLKHRAFLMTVYGAGLRVSEACHLKLEDLHRSRMQIRVVQGKGRKDRPLLSDHRSHARTLAARKRAGALLSHGSNFRPNRLPTVLLAPGFLHLWATSNSRIHIGYCPRTCHRPLKAPKVQILSPLIWRPGAQRLSSTAVYA